MRRQERAAQLIRALWANGPLTRRELEDLLHVSRPTLDKIIRDLAAKNLLLPAGERRERGGRPATLFGLNGRARIAVGADLELPGLYLVAADLAGEVLGERALRVEEPLSSPRDTLREVADAIRRLLRGLGISPKLLGGVGVGMPIFFEGDSVTIKGKNLPTWVRIPAREILEAELGVPAVVGHDIQFMALAECERAGLGDRVVLYVALRAGLRGDIRMGAALLVRGEVYRGAHGNGGTLHDAFVEPEDLDPAAPARAIAERLAPHLVHAIALADPDVVVINASELGEAGPEAAAELERAVLEAIRGEPLGPVEVRRARATAAPGALGAALAAVRSLLERPERLLEEVVAGGKLSRGQNP